MNPEIENLINMALADGGVTEKERGIIIRKAVSLGLDQDEIEMILDGKIALLNKQSSNLENAKPPSQKEGDIKKCPSCGARVQSFSTKCSDCGHEFRNIDSSNSIKQLISKLELAEQSAKNSSQSGGILGGLLAMVDNDTAIERKVFEAKANIISTYPIPNSKEDFLEFLTLSIAQINSIQIGTLERLAGTSGTFGYKIKYKNAWVSVANSVIMKARFSMKEDKSTLAEIEHYAKQLGIK
jgi:hypothetical protein